MDDVTVIELGTKMIRFMQISSVLLGITLVTTCVCQAVGNALGSLILSLSRQGIVFFIAISILPKLFGFNGVLLSQPVSDLITDIIAIALLFTMWYSISDTV